MSTNTRTSNRFRRLRSLVGVAGIATLLLVVIFLLAGQWTRLLADRESVAVSSNALALRAAFYDLAKDLAEYRGALFSYDLGDAAEIGEDAELKALQRTEIVRKIEQLQLCLAPYPSSAALWQRWGDYAHKVLDDSKFVNYTVLLDELLSITQVIGAEARIGAHLTGVEHIWLQLSDELARVQEKVAQVRGLHLAKVPAAEQLLKSLHWMVARRTEYVALRLAASTTANPELATRFESVQKKINDGMAASAALPVPLAPENRSRWFQEVSEVVEAIATFRALLDESLLESMRQDLQASTQTTWLLSGLCALGMLVALLIARVCNSLFAREEDLIGRLEDSEYLHELAVSGAQVGLFDRLDADDHWYWSDELFDLLGYPRSDEPRSLLEIVHEDLQADFHTAQAGLMLAPATRQLQAQLLCGDGVYRWFSLNTITSVNEETGTLRMSGAVINVEEVKEVERLKTQEQRLQQAISELSELNDELEIFARMASHDLQEPLRMISVFMDLLRQDYAASLDGVANEYIEFARDGALRLQAMIEALLEYARAGNAQHDLESVDVREVMATVRTNLQELIDRSEATIELDVDTPVYADRVGLTSLLQNLIANSMKYCSEGAQPRIRVTSCESNGFWRLAVSDNGIGIRAEDCERVFEPFKRLQAIDKAGTGMGLALCKKIVGRWGGNITVRSGTGCGSTFEVTAQQPVVALQGAA